jgi:uncharacterized small protein (DUF1192 family)
MNDMPPLEPAEQNESTSCGRGGRSRWKKGQSGNPAGYHAGQRHKATILAQQLFEGERDEICRAVIVQAKAGDVTAQRLCLERICPPIKSYPISFKLPVLNTIADAQAAIASIVAGTASGEILADEAMVLTNIVATFIKAVDTAEIDARIAALEAQIEAAKAVVPQYNA